MKTNVKIYKINFKVLFIIKKMSTLIQDNSSQVESSGDIVIKDIVYANDIHVSEESVHISHSVLDSTEIQEFSRVTYGTDSSRENGVISFHTLSTDSTTSTKTLPITINTEAEKTQITSVVDDNQITFYHVRFRENI